MHNIPSGHASHKHYLLPHLSSWYVTMHLCSKHTKERRKRHEARGSPAVVWYVHSSQWALSWCWVAGKNTSVSIFKHGWAAMSLLQMLHAIQASLVCVCVCVCVCAMPTPNCSCIAFNKLVNQPYTIRKEVTSIHMHKHTPVSKQQCLFICSQSLCSWRLLIMLESYCLENEITWK